MMGSTVNNDTTLVILEKTTEHKKKGRNFRGFNRDPSNNGNKTHLMYGSKFNLSSSCHTNFNFTDFF